MGICESIKKRDILCAIWTGTHENAQRSVCGDISHGRNSEELRRAKNFNLIRIWCRKIMWSEVGKVSCKSAVMRLWFSLLNRIPVDKAFGMLNFLAGRYSERKADYVTCLSFPDCWVKGYRGFKREYYLNTKRMVLKVKR